MEADVFFFGVHTFLLQEIRIAVGYVSENALKMYYLISFLQGGAGSPSASPAKGGIRSARKR